MVFFTEVMQFESHLPNFSFYLVAVTLGDGSRPIEFLGMLVVY